MVIRESSRPAQATERASIVGVAFFGRPHP